MTQEPHLPIACTLSQSEQARAQASYKAGLLRHVEEVKRRDNGASLRFAWNADRLREIGDFLAVETGCCSFLDHSVEVPRGKKNIWLHFTGAKEAQELLMSELGELLPPGFTLDVSERSGNSSEPPRPWFARLGVGFAGLGLLSVACCVAPALGLGALAAGGAWLGLLLDPIAGVVLAVGFGALVWWWVNRSKKGCGSGC